VAPDLLTSVAFISPSGVIRRTGYYGMTAPEIAHMTLKGVTELPCGFIATVRQHPQVVAHCWVSILCRATGALYSERKMMGELDEPD